MILASCINSKNIENPSIVIDGESTYYAPSEGINITIRLVTNQASWDIDLADATSWITESSRSVTSVSFYIKKNEGYNPRTAEIVFYAPDLSQPHASCTLTIEQQGKEMEPELNVSATSLTFPADGSEQEILVETTYPDWGFEVRDPSWIHIDAREGKMLVKADRNEYDKERSNTVTVFASAANHELSKVISVTQAPADITYETENLSNAASSNCYLITHRGDYVFDATIRGNGLASEGLDTPSTLNPASAQLLWQSGKGMVTGVSFKDGMIAFSVSRIKGNAVIAAKDKNGSIIWSWHIWYPEEEVVGLTSKGGYEVMNMNLGAMDSSLDLASYGLLYQWGRKDPFPGSPIPTGGSVNTKNIPVYDIDGNEVEIIASEMYSNEKNTLEYATANPTECLSNGSTATTDWLVKNQSNTALWGNPYGHILSNGKYNNKGSKSYYDPCPVGWRIPHVEVFQHFTESGQYAWVNLDSSGKPAYKDDGNLSISYFWGADTFNVYDMDSDGKITMSDYQNGWMFYLDNEANTHSFFPASARYDGKYAMLMGSVVGQWGNYWTNTPTLDSKTMEDGYTAVALAFGICDYNKNTLITVSPMGNGARADAYAVRCIKE